MYWKAIALGTLAIALAGCTAVETAQTETAASAAEAVRPVPVVGEGTYIPIETDAGSFEVYTKKVGDSPTMKVLLLHGGPGATHEIFENFADYLPDAGIEFYFYDQLGSYFSDQPDMEGLLSTERFVDEVDQVRTALGLGPDNFYLYGQSWGGLLAIEYALEHPDALKGVIISNMMASIPAYNEYAQTVLMADMDPEILQKLKDYEAAEDYANEDYHHLLMEHHYVDHVLRRPSDEWPDAVNRGFGHLNPSVYIPMQGPSELGASGILADWDRMDDLSSIDVPALVIAAQHDTMDPAYKQEMANRLPQARFALMPNGAHMSQWDDAENYFPALIDFIKDVDDGTFQPD